MLAGMLWLSTDEMRIRREHPLEHVSEHCATPHVLRSQAIASVPEHMQDTATIHDDALFAPWTSTKTEKPLIANFPEAMGTICPDLFCSPYSRCDEVEWTISRHIDIVSQSKLTPCCRVRTT